MPRESVGGGYPGGGGHPGHGHVIVSPRIYGYGYGYPYYYPYYYPYAYTGFYGGGYYNSYWGASFGWGGAWGPGYGPYYGGYPAYVGGSGAFGRLRLQVEPRDAEVFVDGYYTGTVDDFDGRLQGLQLETGGYKVEIRKPGWETLTFEVRVTPDRTTSYKAEMIPQKP